MRLFSCGVVSWRGSLYFMILIMDYLVFFRKGVEIFNGDWKRGFGYAR